MTVKEEPSIKFPDSEAESKLGTELLSGKKGSSTTSRSPNSDIDKKEHDEIMKSSVVGFETPKNPKRSKSNCTIEEESQHKCTTNSNTPTED